MGRGHESFHLRGQSSELNTYIHWVVYNKVFVLLGSSTFFYFFYFLVLFWKVGGNKTIYFVIGTQSTREMGGITWRNHTSQKESYAQKDVLETLPTKGLSEIKLKYA